MNMKKIIVIVAAVLLVIAGLWQWQKGSDNKSVVREVPGLTFERSDMGIEFRYSEDQLVRQVEGGLPVGDMTMLGAVFVGTSTVGQPKISVFTFGETVEVVDEFDALAGAVPQEVVEDETAPKLSKEEKLLAWANKNSDLTGFATLQSEPELTEIDGVAALHFVSKDTYLQDIYLVIYHGRTSMIMGQYEEEGDENYQTFQTFIKNLKLT